MDENPIIEEDETPDRGLTRIVSYLDGELDDTQMNEVEQHLINDPAMRSHADVLSRTWALLDSLEEVSAGRQFTQATLATIATEAVHDDSPGTTSHLKSLKVALARYKVIPCFLAGIVGGAVGMYLSGKASEKREATGDPATTRIVLDNFELVQNADLYSLVPDAEQLKALQLPQQAGAVTDKRNGAR